MLNATEVPLIVAYCQHSLICMCVLIICSTADVLGSGQFGVVYRGQWMVQGGEESIDVAVKTLKQNSQEVDKVKFLQEAAIIGQFSHPNVVKLHGLVLGDRVNYILWLLFIQNYHMHFLKRARNAFCSLQSVLWHVLHAI